LGLEHVPHVHARSIQVRVDHGLTLQDKGWLTNPPAVTGLCGPGATDVDGIITDEAVGVLLRGNGSWGCRQGDVGGDGAVETVVSVPICQSKEGHMGD
jgi:hypothetical protein